MYKMCGIKSHLVQMRMELRMNDVIFGGPEGQIGVKIRRTENGTSKGHIIPEAEGRPGVFEGA